MSQEANDPSKSDGGYHAKEGEVGSQGICEKDGAAHCQTKDEVEAAEDDAIAHVLRFGKHSFKSGEYHETFSEDWR